MDVLEPVAVSEDVAVRLIELDLLLLGVGVMLGVGVGVTHPMLMLLPSLQV